jgi:acetyltransferase
MDHRHAIRELRATDAPRVQEFVRRLSPESRRRRFFSPIRELSPYLLERITTGAAPGDVNLGAYDAAGRIVGLAQYAEEEDNGAEVSVVVDDPVQRLGLGTRLIEVLTARAFERGLAMIHGLILKDNRAMVELAARLGFNLKAQADPMLIRAEKPINAGRPRYARASPSGAASFPDQPRNPFRSR